ncbi:VOC family protein [Caulobacter sp.]|uniref:VOC family protein n=1 Tax=Caulobacter sp. TaxID=78 RepID=UPI002B487E11|nr:VOC family protein [Caulobacter sp.]HJV43681.1 VOC family protein [Caulobacter sp.]
MAQALRARRPGVLGVHSLDHFAITVPDLGVARRFYEAFGLEVHDDGEALAIHVLGGNHRWMRIAPGPRKALKHLSFGIFEDDLERFAARLARLGIAASGGPGASLWLEDPHGLAIELRVAEKSSPDAKAVPAAAPSTLRGAPMRDAAPLVHPRRMSHAAFFTPNLDATLAFYIDALGLRLSDRSGPGAFLHGAHGSEHHMVAFAQSSQAGFHHSAWEVGSVDEVGLGAAQMARAGYAEGWGLGRHVLGSNYFHYVRDPWGSFAEYSFDMDYVPADFDWPSTEASPENGLYLWGPAPPDYFGVNSDGGTH